MTIAQIIGMAAAVVAFLCLLGILAWHLLAPPSEGQHARQPRHREHEHRGYADDDQALDELHRLGVDPPVSLPHRANCTRLDEHVVPIGFDLYESEWTGAHGESEHPDAVSNQCVCGHPQYHTCSDWAYDWDPGEYCQGAQHDRCDGIGIDMRWGAQMPNTCPCDCHAIPLSTAIKQLRTRPVVDYRRAQRDRRGDS